LLAGVHAGSEADFEALFLRHYGQIHSLLQRLVGDEADDLAQEVFWRLYTRPPRDLQGDLRAWLHRVAARLGYNALRARRRQERYRALWASLAVGMGEDRSPGPELVAEQDAERHLVRATLARLGRREATILALRHGGLSYREIAQAMGIAPGSVGTLLARAERAFAALYDALQTGGGGA
jgi:RNA polymerase sigma-70 factor (ECF subfamily)